MNRQFDVVIEKDADGYYVASVPRLRGCHTRARSEIVRGKRALTPDAALRLARLLGMSANFWLGLQQD